MQQMFWLLFCCCCTACCCQLLVCFGSIDFCYHSSKSGMLLATVDICIPKCPSCFPLLTHSLFQPQVCVCCYVYQPFNKADDKLLHPVVG